MLDLHGIPRAALGLIGAQPHKGTIRGCTATKPRRN